MALENDILDIEQVHLSKITLHRVDKNSRFSNYLVDIFGRYMGSALLANLADVFSFLDIPLLSRVFNIIAVAFFFLYYPLLEYFYGKTLGKL